MSDIAIKVENLSKLYQLGEVGTGTLSRDIERWWARTRGKEDPFAKIGQVNDRTIKSESEFVWALKDIDFEVKKGEVLGIIGRNGAGKSTLLKILSKITSPTTGKIYVDGRIASLLEVGTGFHPEMTGRENIFMNGAILGMRKKEIQKKFDAIVDFAGVEKYIDTPVKRYSSGMYVRLAFAVAAFLEPEILIVDEVLAVGDAEFQKKCLGRMKDVSVNEGRTVLFVSHNIPMVQKLCTMGLLLKDGMMNFNSDIQKTLEKYITIQKTEPNFVSENNINKEACILSASLIDENGKECSEVAIGMKWKLKVKFQVNQNIRNLISGIGILNHNDFPINTTWNLPIDAEKGIYQATFENDFLSLATGQYKVVVGLSQGKRSLHYIDNSFFFEVNPIIESISENVLSIEKSTGVVLNQLKTQTIKLK